LKSKSLKRLLREENKNSTESSRRTLKGKQKKKM
jgi:hypothetical protein